MFKPLGRVLGNKQNNNKTQKIQPKPNQSTKKNTRGEGENSNDCEGRFACWN